MTQANYDALVRYSEMVEGLEVEFLATNREGVSGIVVIMPSALSSKREDRDEVVFLRRSWVDLWPDYEVLVFADPALKQDSRLNGAWYLHPEYDVIEAISAVITGYAASFGLAASDVVVYGSSLGGFGALAVATELGCKAVAEVPQVDFREWLTSAHQQVEEMITGMPINEYALRYPAQVSVLHRILKVGRIPEFKIITNPTDRCFKGQVKFFRWAQKSNLPKDGVFQLILRSDTEGHSVLGKSAVGELVQGEFVQ